MQEKNSSWPLELVPKLPKLGSRNSSDVASAALVAGKLERDRAISGLSLSVDGEDIFDKIVFHWAT